MSRGAFFVNQFNGDTIHTPVLAFLRQIQRTYPSEHLGLSLTGKTSKNNYLCKHFKINFDYINSTNL